MLNFGYSLKISALFAMFIVIIVEKLTKNIFDEINSSFQRIKSSEIGLDDYDILINNTFGPLKFDTEKNIGVCGDWCRGDTVLDAAISGASLAEKIISFDIE